MKIYITRHSLTQWNQEKRLQGTLDSPLTKEGIEDALCLKKRIASLPIDLCIASPILRAKKTAQLLFDESMIQYDKRIQEMNFGDFEGQYVQDIAHTQEYIDLWQNSKLETALPNGESFKEVLQRLHQFLDDLYQNYKDKSVFIVTHGMTLVILRTIMMNQEISYLPDISKTVIRGCSLSFVEYDGQNFKINFINDQDHLNKSNVDLNYHK